MFTAVDRGRGFVPFVVELGQPFPEFDTVLVELDGVIPPAYRLGEMAELLRDQADMGVGRRQGGIELNGAHASSPRLVEAIHHPQEVAQVVVQFGRVWLKPHRFAAVFQGLVVAAAREDHLARVGTRGGVGRLKLEGAADVLQGGVEPPQLAESQAQVVVGDNKARPQFDGPTQRLDGLGMPPQGRKRGPQDTECLGIMRFPRSRVVSQSRLRLDKALDSAPDSATGG